MVLVVTSAALLDATREPIRGWNKIVQSSSMRNKYLSKLIVIEATLFKHEMTNGQEELKLNLIGLNIIIAVYCNGCVKKWSSGFEKRFQEAITWRRWCQYRQRLWIPIYSIYWFFVKNHRCCFWISVQAQMVFEIGEELGRRGKWWKPKSSISGTTVNDIVHVYIRDDHDGKKCTWPFGKQSLLYWLR